MRAKTNKYYLSLAYKLAKKGYGFVSPNPMVGAVLVKDGEVLGMDYHKEFGKGHAEANLLGRFAQHDLKDCILYISLEPCCFVGKTGSCTNLILKAGLKKVVFSEYDPNPLVSGKGVKFLKDNGIEVEYYPMTNFEYLNRKFKKWINSSFPYICLKAAVTLDFKIADKFGNSKWITGEVARNYVDRQRQGYDAILVGSNTLKHDNPSLTVKNYPRRNELFRFIFSSNKDLNLEYPDFNAFKTDSYAIVSSYQELLDECNKRGISSVYVEGGAGVFAYFLENGFYDELNLFYAPKLLGSTHFGLDSKYDFESLSKSKNLELVSSKRLGEDILVKYK